MNESPVGFNETQFAITIFIALLLIASGVAMASKWVRVPYTLMLVIVGLIVSPMHFLPVVHISPELILMIFLPALLFEAAWNLKLRELQENLWPILLLAMLGVTLSVGVIGLILHHGIELTWSKSMLFGAMIAATDPVSVLALFSKLGLPRRLTTIVEGESLFNDGAAAVVFGILLGIVEGTTQGGAGELVLKSVQSFGVEVFGGVAVGATVGILGSTLTSKFDDHLLEITLTTIAAYGTYLVAQSFHVSGVIAVLITGLVIGNYGRRIGMSPTTQVAVNSFWEYAAFVVNSLVFLLIGLEVQLPILVDNLRYIAWGVLAMLVARIVAVYLLVPLSNRFTEPIPVRWRHVLFWGGLRGSLSMALVLSIPTAVSGRSELVVMIFGTVLFSLLVQGLSISPLLRWLKLSQPVPKLREFELLHGRLLLETAAMAELDSMRKRGLVTDAIDKTLRTNLIDSHQMLNERLAQTETADRDLEQQQLNRLQRHLLDVKKARLSELMREGILSKAAYHEINAQIDEDFASQSESSHEP